MNEVPTGSAADTLSAFADRPESALRTIGFRLVSADPEAATAACAFTAGPMTGNLLGVVQGGFVAAMLDATMSSALLCSIEAGGTAPTVDLHVSYLRPTPLGELTGSGRVVHQGGSTAFLSGELRDPEGEVTATAVATVRIVRRARGAG